MAFRNYFAIDTVTSSEPGKFDPIKEDCCRTLTRPPASKVRRRRQDATWKSIPSSYSTAVAHPVYFHSEHIAPAADALPREASQPARRVWR